MVLEAFSVSHGKASAYLPVIELLHNYFGIAAEDDARKRREKITGKVLMLDRTLEDTLPYLFSLLGIVEETTIRWRRWTRRSRRRRTLEAIKRILLRESLNQPLIVIFEDLHWIDERDPGAAESARRQRSPTRASCCWSTTGPSTVTSWGSKTYYTQLRLDPLGKESADEMLAALARRRRGAGDRSSG